MSRALRVWEQYYRGLALEQAQRGGGAARTGPCVLSQEQVGLEVTWRDWAPAGGGQGVGGL